MTSDVRQPAAGATEPARAPDEPGRAADEHATAADESGRDEPARAAPEPAHRVHDDHDEHRHGPDCGHRTLPHEDHVDYIHDGHRHVEHDGHWDEHGTKAGDETMDWSAMEQAAAVADVERRDIDADQADEGGASADDLLT